MATRLPIPITEKHTNTPQRHAEYANAKGGTGLGIIMLQYPLDIPRYWPEGWSDEIKRHDLRFYAAQKRHANAMYWWAFAIAWLSLGDKDLAAKYLDLSTAHNVYGSFHTWSELPHGRGCPNF